MPELNPSKLGTREYWDTIYTREIQNFLEFGDKGEVWFGEQARMEMIDYCEELDKSWRIIDLGCGNGHLLFDLYDFGFRNLLGLDYSHESVQLCRDIALKEEKDVEFIVCDILGDVTLGKAHVLLDKGTYDAISLSGIAEACQKYVENAHNLLEKDGFLLITSCNWTEDELITRFNQWFDYHDRIKYPSFKFGGVVGQTISSVILKPIHKM
jgi:EEF1A lysine methyltransferase 2